MKAAPSDASLVERMAVGDRSALASLYERHAPRLLGLAMKMLGDRAEAEDLLHDVFLEAWRKAHDYRVDRGPVAAWLSTRTRSRALDRIKSAGRRRNVSMPQATELSAVAAPVDDRAKLRALIVQMPESQREVLLLAYFADLSSREIGEHLGLPVGTVKSRMRAALSALRAILAESSDG